MRQMSVCMQIVFSFPRNKYRAYNTKGSFQLVTLEFQTREDDYGDVTGYVSLCL